jgi:NADPH:quinone reductase
MKAVCITLDHTLEAREVPSPGAPARENVVVRMEASAINPGDVFFLRHPLPLGAPASRYDVWGASGAGTVLAAGAQVSSALVGRRVAVYRSLVPSDDVTGCWSELAEVPALSCLLLPEGAKALDYCGSLVNLITPYAFWQEAKTAHRGVLVTAGNSATGVAMLGFARVYDVPIVMLARGPSRREELLDLGAKDVVVESDPAFDDSLRAALERVGPVAVFDGIGGALASRVGASLPRDSTFFCYGALDTAHPLAIPSRLLMTKNLTLRAFANFRTPTVMDPRALSAALTEISRLLGGPHFKTKVGKTFRFEGANDAIAWKSDDGAKAVLAAE